MMNHDIEVEPARSLSPIEDAEEAAPESNLGTAQFEAIIRAWKGEAVGQEGAIPASPVGEADLDGSRTLEQFAPLKMEDYPCTQETLWPFMCSYDCRTQVASCWLVAEVNFFGAYCCSRTYETPC